MMILFSHTIRDDSVRRKFAPFRSKFFPFRVVTILKRDTIEENQSTTISVIMSVQCSPLPQAYRALTKPQFYAPTKASIKEFWLCPAIILRKKSSHHFEKGHN